MSCEGLPASVRCRPACEAQRSLAAGTAWPQHTSLSLPPGVAAGGQGGLRSDEV